MNELSALQKENKMMGIKWAPLNVPMHRRMEVIAVAVCMSIALFGGPVGALIVLYCLVNVLELSFF